MGGHGFSSSFMTYILLNYLVLCYIEEELIIPDPNKGKKAIAAMLRLKQKPR